MDHPGAAQVRRCAAPRRHRARLTRVRRSRSRGRCAIATRDIAAGELVLLERAFAFSPRDRFAHAVCHHCLADLPAERVGSSAFCSAACSAAAVRAACRRLRQRAHQPQQFAVHAAGGAGGGNGARQRLQRVVRWPLRTGERVPAQAGAAGCGAARTAAAEQAALQNAELPTRCAGSSARQWWQTACA